MPINRLYWITHAPIAMLLGLCDLSLSVMCAPPAPTPIDLILAFIGAMATSIIYIEAVAPFVEQYDPRFFEDTLWDE